MKSYYLIFLIFIETGFSNGLFINEFLARNDLCCEDGNGDNEDFFEIYNNGDTEVDLSGYFVTDDLADSAKYKLPNGTVISAGGFLAIWCDSDSNGLHTNFKLKGSGEEIGLFDTDTTMIDGIAYDAQCTDVSSVRFPDGTETWNSTLSPTPGEVNEFNPGPVYDIVINEIFYNGDADYPDSTYEFFELYNNDVSTVDLSGYFLTEGVDFTFPDSSSIASDEYIVVTVDTLMYAGNGYQVFQWTDGALSNGGEDIQLMNTDCGVVDYVDYDDSDPWPEEADGNGPTLELINPSLDNTLAESWRASDVIGGTPGASNGGLNLTSINIDFLVSWNLVGLPAGVEDGSLSAVYPEGTGGTLYSFDGAYVGEDALIPGEGYWLHFPDPGTTTITGTPISSLTLSLTAGWNLFSGISEVTNVSGISDPGGIIVAGTVYGFTGSYINASVLTPGHGYWVNASADGDITISSGGAAKTRSAFTDRTVKANKLSFNGNDLYFGVSIPEEEMLSYQLPPKPPAGAFDVRFAENMKVAESSGAIEIMNNTDKLTISCAINIDAGEHMRWTLTSNEGKEHELNGSGEIVVGGDVTGFNLSKVPEIPLTYSISQNYPNPFNPVTSISFSMPISANVKIAAYDIVGNQVGTILNQTISAGTQSVIWNAKNRPSGVYFIRMESGAFVRTQKVILLK